MNPLILKFGIPAAIIAVIAFMRWTNSKATGEPFFPGVDDSTGKKGGGSGGLQLPKIGLPAEMRGDSSVVAPDTASSSPFSDQISDDQQPIDYGTPSNQVTGAGAGSGVAGSGLPAMGGDIRASGVSQPSQPVANAIIASTVAAPYSGSYQPYSPTPQTVAPINQFGGAGSGTFAI